MWKWRVSRVLQTANAPHIVKHLPFLHVDEAKFQLQIGPVTPCTTWTVRIYTLTSSYLTSTAVRSFFLTPQTEKVIEIKMAISRELDRVISTRCNCSVPKDSLKGGRFRCWNTPNEVTYRNKIVSNTANTSRLVEYIEEWVKTEQPFIPVGDFDLKVYKDCPVHISSMNDPECTSTELPPDMPSVIASSDQDVIQCLNVCLVRKRGEALCPSP